MVISIKGATICFCRLQNYYSSEKTLLPCLVYLCITETSVYCTYTSAQQFVARMNYFEPINVYITLITHKIKTAMISTFLYLF